MTDPLALAGLAALACLGLFASAFIPDVRHWIRVRRRLRASRDYNAEHSVAPGEIGDPLAREVLTHGREG